MTLRYNTQTNPCDIQTQFIGIQTGNLPGAEGLCECVKNSLIKESNTN